MSEQSAPTTRSLGIVGLVIIGLTIGLAATFVMPVAGSAGALIVVGYAASKSPNTARALAIIGGSVAGCVVPLGYAFWWLLGPIGVLCTAAVMSVIPAFSFLVFKLLHGE